jgi:hypothetical protein
MPRAEVPPPDRATFAQAGEQFIALRQSQLTSEDWSVLAAVAAEGQLGASVLRKLGCSRETLEG